MCVCVITCGTEHSLERSIIRYAMHPPSLRALVLHVIATDVTLHYDNIMGWDNFIGYAHDVGYQLLEAEGYTLYRAKDKKMKKKIKEKERKLMDIFIHKIHHMKGMTLFLSPYSMLLKDTYLHQFLSFHAAKVDKVIMTDVSFKYYSHRIVPICPITPNIHKIIKALASNISHNPTMLRLTEARHYKHMSMINLKGIYESHISHTISVLNLCHINFTYCGIMELRRCTQSLINLTELRVVDAEIKYQSSTRDVEHRHLFTLPMPLHMSGNTQGNYYCCACNKKKKYDRHVDEHDEHDAITAITGNLCQCHTRGRMLQVLVFTEAPCYLRPPHVCTAENCPQVQEFNSLFLYYSNLRVLDLTNVNLNTNSLKVIISNSKKRKIEKLTLTASNSEQQEIIDRYQGKQSGFFTVTDYHDLMRYVTYSKCTRCVTRIRGALMKLAWYVIRDLNRRENTMEKIQSMNHIIKLIMDYGLRHCTNEKVMELVLVLMKDIMTYCSLLFLWNYITCIRCELGIWISHLEAVYRYCFISNTWVKYLIKSIICMISWARDQPL